MNASKLSTVERLAEELVARLTIEIEASGRHVHLSRVDVETLFGPGYRLNRTKDLSQPGQFACAERVTLEGPRGSLKNVVILGPERPESQVEISLTDAVALGLTPPVRLSGDTEGTPGLTLRHGDRVLRLSRGLIVAKRHIHMTPEDAARFAVMQRVGMTKRDIRTSVNAQLRMVFLLPLLAAFVHLAFAQPMIWRILRLFGL